jgi:cyclopropane fatty-acyl-phospholipid synthase-like methyltransferase
MNKTIIDDREYWDDFYKNDKGLHTPSLFSRFVCENYISSDNGNLFLEIGCGNGRDTEYFAEKNLLITAIDISEKAINDLEKKFHEYKNVELLCQDFVNINYNNKYNYCYSRFSIHSINAEKEDNLITRISKALVTNGMFFIEARCVDDDIYGKGIKVGKDEYIYEGHYRRFIRLGQLIKKMEDNNFIIEYATEKKDLAPFGDSNPYIIRVVGKKR